MEKTRFEGSNILNGVCVFGDIWGSIGVYIGGIVCVRNKGEGQDDR